MFCTKSIVFLTFFFLTSAAAKLKNEDDVLEVIIIRPTVQTIIMSTGFPNRVLEEELTHLNRVERAAPTTCQYPRQRSNDSEVFCKVYVNRIECEQTCMFGYEVKGQKSRTLSCYFKEDKWKPASVFGQCERKVNCDLRLEGAGELVCQTRFMKHGPRCQYQCYYHGYQDGGKLGCDEHGNWHPKLPSCLRKAQYH